MSKDNQPDWDLALECAARMAEASEQPEIAAEIRAMMGEEMKPLALQALAQMDADAETAIMRDIFQNVEMGFITDHGDGTFSLTDKGRDYVENKLLPPSDGDESTLGERAIRFLKGDPQ